MVIYRVWHYFLLAFRFGGIITADEWVTEYKNLSSVFCHQSARQPP